MRKHNINRVVKNRVRDAVGDRPSYATVVAVGNNTADIRVGNVPTITRSVEVLGDPTSLSEGQTVYLQWLNKPGIIGKMPVVVAGGINTSGSHIYAGNIIPDNETIEYGSDGLRVKTHSIDFEHLNFIPALVGHEHIELRGGWQISPLGVLRNGGLTIDPAGYINIGWDDDVITIGTLDETYYIWAGGETASVATFKVSKDGMLYATAGEIAGWTLSETGFTSDDGSANIIPGDYPRITLGAASAFDSGVGIWLGKDDADDIYKLRVGDPLNDNMYWDGSALVITGLFIGGSEIGYTITNQFTINYNGDDVDAGLIINRTTGAALWFTWNGELGQINRPLKPTDLVINRLTSSEPTSTFAGLVWIDPDASTPGSFAADISIDDAGDYYTSDNVEDAFQEVGVYMQDTISEFECRQWMGL